MEKITYGLEEEVFVCEPLSPSLSSFLYLARLLAKDPVYYYQHTASNLTRGRDIKQGLVSGVEISTAICPTISSLIKDLKKRRQDLIRAVGQEGLIVPLGHLINKDASTNVCAWQVHLGVPKDKIHLIYNNLAYFLPLLILAGANSPYKNETYFGQSYRMKVGYAIGPLKKDPTLRFQDLIISRRLGTIEIRVFDSLWDLERIRKILEIIQAITKIQKPLPFRRSKYARLRSQIIKKGFILELEPLYQQLCAFYPLSRDFFLSTPADQVVQLYNRYGLLGTYSALDNAYRFGPLKPQKIPPLKKKRFQSFLAFGFYYSLKAPYNLWKWLKEKD